MAALWLAPVFAARPQPKGAQRPPQAAVKTQPARPTIPTANRNDASKVFLEHADRLDMDPARSADYQLLEGNVVFRKQGMWMYCDSARFYEDTSSLEAFGNVRMEQGDTLFVYGSELDYDGPTELGRLFGDAWRKARLVNRDVQMESDVFEYDLAQEFGYYLTGGRLYDKRNTLTSWEGEYYPSTKEAWFYNDVVLTGPRDNGDTIRLYTDSLLYNTGTGIATIIAPTRIVNRDGVVYSTAGTFDTNTEEAELLERSTVVTNRGTTITGDTLFYDRQRGEAEAFGRVVIDDTTKHVAFFGQYGYYAEANDSTFATGDALAIEYSRRDTLYIHADTLTGRRLPGPDSVHVASAFHRARFFARDYQGVADSLSIIEADSVMTLHRHPVLWSGTRQVHGAEMWVHYNDSTADWARMPTFGMTTEHIGENCYNQMAGNDMTVWLADSALTRLYVEGNVQMILFPMENDSTFNKMTFVETSYLDARFDSAGTALEHCAMWPQSSGKVTPLYLARKADMRLAQFAWYAEVRPLSAASIFTVPAEMDALMALPDPGAKKSARRAGHGPETAVVAAEAAADAPRESKYRPGQPPARFPEPPPPLERPAPAPESENRATDDAETAPESVETAQPGPESAETAPETQPSEPSEDHE